MGCIIDELKELIEKGTKRVQNKTAKTQIESFIKALETARPQIDPENLQLNTDKQKVVEEAEADAVVQEENDTMSVEDIKKLAMEVAKECK